MVQLATRDFLAKVSWLLRKAELSLSITAALHMSTSGSLEKQDAHETHDMTRS